MSVTSKKRYVMNQVESELFLPKENELIARVLGSPGRNLHEVEDEKGERYLVSMPRKFRETIYIKRDNFIFVTPIEEGVKVKAEITQILDKENILYIREKKMWPERFEVYAESITREAKRGIAAGSTRKHDVIDEDMLPPSDTDDDDGDESEEEEEEDQEEEEEDDEEKKEGDKGLKGDSPDVAGNGEAKANGEAGSSDEDEDEEESDGDDDDSSTFKIYNPNRLRRL